MNLAMPKNATLDYLRYIRSHYLSLKRISIISSMTVKARCALFTPMSAKVYHKQLVCWPLDVTARGGEKLTSTSHY